MKFICGLLMFHFTLTEFSIRYSMLLNKKDSNVYFVKHQILKILTIPHFFYYFQINSNNTMTYLAKLLIFGHYRFFEF
jgi:hypothetical protein